MAKAPSSSSSSSLASTATADKYAEGDTYFYGLGQATIDHTKAKECWIQAAKEGHHSAMGRCYFFGIGGYRKDLSQSFRCFEQSACGGDSRINDGEYAPGLFLLGFCYLYGSGVDQNEARGFELQKQAAELKYPPAINNVGRYYQKHEQIAKALTCFLEAAGHRLASAEFTLGTLCLMDEGDNLYMNNPALLSAISEPIVREMDKDARSEVTYSWLAKQWIARAAAQGHSTAIEKLSSIK